MRRECVVIKLAIPVNLGYLSPSAGRKSGENYESGESCEKSCQGYAAKQPVITPCLHLTSLEFAFTSPQPPSLSLSLPCEYKQQAGERLNPSLRTCDDLDIFK